MEDKCVCCGEYVPEGRQVCKSCETVHGAEWIKNNLHQNSKVEVVSGYEYETERIW